MPELAVSVASACSAMGVCLSKQDVCNDYPLVLPVDQVDSDSHEAEQGCKNPLGECRHPLSADESEDLNLTNESEKKPIVNQETENVDIYNDKAKTDSSLLSCLTKSSQHVYGSSEAQNLPSSTDLSWDFACTDNKISRSCSDKEISLPMPVKCIRMNTTNSVDGALEELTENENLGSTEECQSTIDNFNSDKIYFGIPENCFERPNSLANLLGEPFKSQLHLLFPTKNGDATRLSRFSKSSRISTCRENGNFRTESPRSKFIGLLMKSLSFRSRTRISNIQTKSPSVLSDTRSGDDKYLNGYQKELQILSHINTRREENSRPAKELMNEVGSGERREENSRSEGMRESSSFLVAAEKALDSRFSIDSLCSDAAELAERFRVYAQNNAQRKRSLRCQNGLVTEELSSQGRRSKRIEFLENLTSARVSADASSDSSSDLFDLEFPGNGPFAGVWLSVD